jgi:GTP-binding protein
VKVRTVELAGVVATRGGELPGKLPQVAFSGRSNVGKSSLINVLLGRTRKKLAHVSSRPGKTQTLNFYEVNHRFFLVDLPGFGYARAPGPVRESWKGLVEWYLSRGEGIRGVVHLVDSRHPPTALDRRMMEYLGELGLPALVVLTKIDRISRGRRPAALRMAVDDLGLDPEQLIPFSAKTGEGKEPLLEALDHLLSDDRMEAS